MSLRSWAQERGPEITRQVKVLIRGHQRLGAPDRSETIVPIDTSAVEQSFQVDGEMLQAGGPVHFLFRPDSLPT